LNYIPRGFISLRTLTSIQELCELRKTLKGSVGLVPTMGALHEGHLSLIKQARLENDHVIVSVFVNPTQFLAGEDLSTYPRKPEADAEICRRAGVDDLFMPDITAMYGEDEPFVHAPLIRGYVYEGYERPGHFNGVLSVVLKLFNLTQPTRAYFGKKDAQQLLLIEDMVKRLFLPLSIVACETIREKSGLALSSRNVYLSEEEREEALKLSKSLNLAAKLISDGVHESAIIKARMEAVLAPLKIDYIAITDRRMHPLAQIERHNSVIAIAARLGKTRLIDNIWL